MEQTATAPAQKEFKQLSEAEYNNLLKTAQAETPKEVTKEGLDVKPLAKKEESPEEKKILAKGEITPEANKPETPVEEAKPETPKKKFRERIKGDFLTSQKPAEAKPEEINVTELQKKIQDYEKEINDTDYQTYKAIKAKGKKSIDILQEVMGQNPDKMSDEEVYRHDLTKAGITDPDKVAEEMDLFFNQGSERARKKELEQIRSGMRRDMDNVQSEFFNKLTAPDPNQERENMQLQKDAEDFGNLVQSAVGQEIYGVQFNKDMATRILTKMSKGELIPKKEDGVSIDTMKLFKMQVLAEFDDLIFDNIEKTFFSEGVHKIADEVEATPASKTITARPPDVQHKVEKGTEEWAKKTSETLVPYNG